MRGFTGYFCHLFQFQPYEKSEDEQEPKRKKVKTLQPVQTEEGESNKIKTNPPDISTTSTMNPQLQDTPEKGETSKIKTYPLDIPTTSTVNPQLQDTPRKIKLKKQLNMKNMQIKRLQSKKRYLKKKLQDCKKY